MLQKLRPRVDSGPSVPGPVPFPLDRVCTGPLVLSRNPSPRKSGAKGQITQAVGLSPPRPGVPLFPHL